MGERASCRDEKDELKCERARAQRRMMIDRLSRGLEFDFSFRRHGRIHIVRHFVSAFLPPFFFFFFFVFRTFPPRKSRRRVFRFTCIVRYPCIVASGDFPGAHVEECHREENARRSSSIGRIISTNRLCIEIDMGVS